MRVAGLVRQSCSTASRESGCGYASRRCWRCRGPKLQSFDNCRQGHDVERFGSKGVHKCYAFAAVCFATRSRQVTPQTHQRARRSGAVAFSGGIAHTPPYTDLRTNPSTARGDDDARCSRGCNLSLLRDQGSPTNAQRLLSRTLRELECQTAALSQQ